MLQNLNPSTEMSMLLNIIKSTSWARKRIVKFRLYLAKVAKFKQSIKVQNTTTTHRALNRESSRQLTKMTKLSPTQIWTWDQRLTRYRFPSTSLSHNFSLTKSSYSSRSTACTVKMSQIRAKARPTSASKWQLCSIWVFKMYLLGLKEDCYLIRVRRARRTRASETRLASSPSMCNLIIRSSLKIGWFCRT